MSIYRKGASGFLVALFVAIAFTGAATPDPVGIKTECMDGIDNDNDGNPDEMDEHCFEYPFADGGGEYETTSGPSGKMFSSSSYTMSVFDYHYSIGPHMIMCQFGSDPQVYVDADFNSNGEDNSLNQWIEWKGLNCN